MKQGVLKILYFFLAYLARYYLFRTRAKVIAITGSVGKTSCRTIITQVLQDITKQNPGEKSLRISTSPHNYNSELGLVLAVFEVTTYHPGVAELFKLSFSLLGQAIFAPKKYDILIAEYGIDSPGDMDRLLRIAVPDIAVLTKLDGVHSANFPGGVYEYWSEKWKLLFAASQKVYLDASEDFSEQYISHLSHYELLPEIKNISQIQVKKDSETLFRTDFVYKKKHISLSTLGEENIIYTCLAFGIVTDLDIEITKQDWRFDFTMQAGRFQIFEKGDHIFIDSSYNAAPSSMEQVISHIKLLQKNIFPKSRLIYVLGDMRELGELSKEAHRVLASHLLDAEKCFFIGPELSLSTVPELKKIGYTGEIHASLSSRETGVLLKKYLKNNHGENYLILFKGSQNTIYTEEALAVLLTPTERKKLPRQSPEWQRKKQIFFREV